MKITIAYEGQTIATATALNLCEALVKAGAIVAMHCGTGYQPRIVCVNQGDWFGIGVVGKDGKEHGYRVNVVHELSDVE